MARPPKTRTTYPPFVNLRGEPIDLRTLRELGRPPMREPAEPAAPPVELEPAEVETVFDALCLAGAPRGKTWLTAFLKALPRTTQGGKAFGTDDVARALKTLLLQRRVSADDGAGFDVTDPVRQQWLAEHLNPELAAAACMAWVRASAPAYAPPTGDPGMPPNFRHHRDMVALARLAVHAGMDLDAFQRTRARVLGLAGEPQLLAEAVLHPFDASAFAAFDPALRAWLLEEFHRRFDTRGTMWRPLRDWLDGEVARQPESVTPLARLYVAERRLMRGDLPGMQAALAGLQGPSLPLLVAAGLAWQGRWQEADAAFAAAVKAIAAVTRSKRGLVPTALLQWWVLALLAQPDAAAWTTARKLCVAESGSRKPAADEGWGLWAHAIAVRLGDESLLPRAFVCQHAWSAAGQDDNAHRLVLAAWAGHSPGDWTPTALKASVRTLHEQGLSWKADLVRQAIARLGWEVPPHEPGDPAPWPVAFFGSPREAWRDALAAIEALGDQRGAGAAAEAPPTLEWHLRLDGAGRVIEVEPHERSVGSRGPGKAKPVTLARVKKSTRLDPRDAAVARCIATVRYSSTALGIDVAGAAMALVNHPAVFFAEAPWQAVELREGLPELDVQRLRRTGTGGVDSKGQDDSHDGKAGDAGDEYFVFRLLDPLVGDKPVDIGERWTANDRDTEAERRNSIRIVREGAERARLIRVTPAQRRVAELVAKQWAVPVDAKAELDAALRVLAGHFQLHSDAATGEKVAANSRLRAQLTPRGDALQLRLLVRPFGAFGPTVVPGHGRPRLITQHEGLNLQTERDLAQEASHLQSVLDAVPFLAEIDSPDAAWLLEDPEQALATLEALPRLPAVEGLDWPRGKPVRVTPVASKAVQIAVSSGRDWFAVDGEVTIDEGRVLGLQQLMQLAQASRQGRFVALGDGEYLALTDRLRQQLADLQALGQADKQGFKLPAAAAAFLSDTLDGTTMAGDKPWARRLALLEESAALDPQPPAALQAQLRGYQAEGYAWMSRLAHAGLGACLADDMGLGKTVQTLALLLSRAALGPALVIAPTSVCGNWTAEAARFAPSLRVLNYGEGDRQALLAEAGAGDLVIASYALAQIDDEAFGAREWATLVLDEAQALKNAATKRAKAIATLQAGFRLALTGTPVENRLADLWSIMNLLNPGLLGSSGQFNDRFAGPIERQRDEAARGRLRRLVSAFLLRRTKAQVLTDLPPRTEIVHRIEPGPEERTFLEATRRSAIERIAGLGDEVAEGQAAFHVLAELTRLRRAACDPRLVAPELGIVGAKAQEFEQLALELVAGRHKALVFSQFTDFLKLLAERLVAAGISYQYLDGSTPAAERTKRVAAFQAGVGDLFLISLKAGGFGLNLTAADYVLIVDPWWNPAAEDQAMGRAHRIGQQRPVTVYRLVTAGSVEERIVALHQDKRSLADGILEGQDQGKPIGAAELRELLGAV
jgi:superfamily II DNA or RNA helicase